MRRLLFAGLLLACGAQDPWAFEGQSAHYTIQSTGDRKQAQEVLKYMDLCFETYRKFLNPAPERLPQEKFVLVLYRDRDEYKARGGQGRYGHYDGKRLVSYGHPEQMLPTFAHEGMHQFTDLSIPNFERLPAWYTEGIAECIANNEVRGGRLFMCLRKGPVPKLRVPAVQATIRDGTFVRLKDLLRTGREKFQERHELFYAESWLFCHFLLTYPRTEDPAKQIPDGKYKDVIVRFHNAMLDPKMKVDAAIKQAFVHDKKPIDLDELEKEFRDYALGFDAAR